MFLERIESRVIVAESFRERRARQESYNRQINCVSRSEVAHVVSGIAEF
jgi:hypothetical protein